MSSSVENFGLGEPKGIDALLDELESDACNVILTLARIWKGVVTDEIVTKDSAAEWVLGRLPEEHRQVLSEARAIYLDEQVRWPQPPIPSARSYAHYVASQIRAHPEIND